MPAILIQYILLVLAILFLVMLADKLKIAYPIVLVLSGLVLSLIPGMPVISIDPELIFIIFLPPLLYEAAWYISWKGLWKWRRVISSFAFLIVIVTSFVIAIVASSLLPGFTLALGFLLGGIISPPDAVSATSVLRYVKVPRRLVDIVEGESLLNDASGLIVFRFALIAVDTGRFVFHEAALSFVWVISAGIAIGIIIGMAYYAVHKWLPTTPNIDIVLTLTAPYVMYIVAESIHVSGVLSVVSGGLFLTVRSHLFLSHRSRLRGSNVWSTLGFVLNGLVFMLIGLELPVIIKQLGPVSLKTAVWYSIIITTVLIVSRVACTFIASVFTRFISRYITTADNNPGLKLPFLFGWAGMRGVVSLAAALSIPIHLSNGTPFPERNLILFITFMVILLTLVVQGLTLPLFIKWLKLKDPDSTMTPEEQEKLLKQKLAKHSLLILDNNHAETLSTNKQLQQLRLSLENDHLAKVDEKEQNTFLHVSLQLLHQKRQLLHDLNKKQELSEAVIRKYNDMLDLEEERLLMRYDPSASAE